MHTAFRAGSASVLAAALLLLCWIAPAAAVTGTGKITAGSVNIAATADCSTNANLDLSWTGAGNHFEFGAAYDAAGTIIGTFGPDTSANNDWNGPYIIALSTAQPADALIGAYAWVGSNPPTQATAIEYFVVYNCSTRAVLYRCAGVYGTCAKTVSGAIVAPGPDIAQIPATSREMLVVLMVLLATFGATFLRRVAQR